MVFQYGGPGVAGSAPPYYWGYYGFEQYFDMVVADPRGIGLNYPVKCAPKYEGMKFQYFPATEDEYLDTIVALLKEQQKRTGIKLLWGTAQLFVHPRYMHGAATSPNAEVFAFAAAQVKKALEVTHALGGEGYTFWGGREGYSTLWNTDMKRELEHLAKFLHMAVDYAKEIGFKGQFYIEPKPKVWKG